MFKNIVINKVIFESIDINQNINSDKKIFKNIAIDIDKGSRRLKKVGFYETNSQKGGGGQSVFILLFRNLKAQNGIFWARIECLDNSVCG